MRMGLGAQTAHILIVEDNPDDIVLLQEALADVKIVAKLSIAQDGVEALQLLRREGKYSEQARPDIILLDLNLPKKDGREVLAEIKQDRTLKHIPVVILTTSENEDDIRRAYEQHANAYLTKPIDYNDFVRVTQVIQDFWLTLVKLPKIQE